MSEPVPSSPTGRAPIKMPTAIVWREFRSSFVPPMVFLVAVLISIVLWRHNGSNTGFTGLGEGARSLVSSPRLATVQELLVGPFQLVNAGDPVAVVAPIDPRAALGLLQAELDLARLSLQPTVAEENAMNFEQIRISFLQTRSELAMARVNLELAENQVRRQAPLHAEKLLSEELYDLSVKTRDLHRAEVTEKSNAVVQIERRLGELQSLGVPSGTNQVSPLAATLDRLQALRVQMATNWLPITLRAPISGMVGAVFRQAGENAVEGEPIIQINSLTSERVVGYLRQPYPIEPQVGLEVVMTTREHQPRRLTGRIVRVGAQVEIITNALAVVRTGTLVDAGLPIAISLPAGLSVRPGEVLDLSIRPSRARSVAEQTPQPAPLVLPARDAQTAALP